MYIFQKVIAVQNLQISSAKHIRTLFSVECNTHTYIWKDGPRCMAFLKQGCSEITDEMRKPGWVFDKRENQNNPSPHTKMTVTQLVKYARYPWK